MDVREATTSDVTDVLSVLDGGALETEFDDVSAAIGRGEAFVAVSDDHGTILGALVLDGDHVLNVAVRRARRGQGIGTALVEAAATGRDALTAECDADVRPFYEQLGFTVERTSETGRYRGVWSVE